MRERGQDRGKRERGKARTQDNLTGIERVRERGEKMRGEEREKTKDEGSEIGESAALVFSLYEEERTGEARSEKEQRKQKKEKQ